MTSATRGTVIFLAALVLLAFGVGCTAPGGGASGAPPSLYVLNGQDATITRLDGGTGRPMGSLAPAGLHPIGIAPGPNGSVVVLSGVPGQAPGLTYVAPGGNTGGWTQRHLSLEGAARGAMLAGDGVRYAAVVYDQPGAGATEATGTRCRLALVDVAAWRVERIHTVCGAREVINGLALEHGAAGPIAYVASWGWHDGDGPGPAWSGRGGRIVALEARSGAVLASVHLPGSPAPLTLGPAPDGLGQRLYCVEATPGPESEYVATGGWRLLGLNPATLDVERQLQVAYLPRRLAVAPDGNHLYTLDAGGTTVLHHDLSTGRQRTLARLRGEGASLAVTATDVYVPNLYGSEVWALDRRTGHTRATPVGRRPTAIVAGGAAAGHPGGGSRTE
jgi:hypothetical protein